MLKKLAVIVGVIILLAGALFFFLIISLDSRIKGAVEENAAMLTGTVVSIEDVDVSILSGNGTLSGLKVSNPEGFSDKPALSLARIQFEIDLDNLAMDLIPIALIQAEEAEILVEKNGEGRINYQELSANLKEAAGKRNSQEKEAGYWEPNLKISRFILNESKVTLAGFGDNSRDVSIPDLELKNLGGSKGMPLEKAGEEILSGIFSEVIRYSVQSGIQKWIEKNTVIPDSLKELLNQGLSEIN